MIAGIIVVVDFLFDYNKGKVTMNVKTICKNIVSKF